jgi:hypothetical protein
MEDAALWKDRYSAAMSQLREAESQRVQVRLKHFHPYTSRKINKRC